MSTSPIVALLFKAFFVALTLRICENAVAGRRNASHALVRLILIIKNKYELEIFRKITIYTIFVIYV